MKIILRGLNQVKGKDPFDLDEKPMSKGIGNKV